MEVVTHKPTIPPLDIPTGWGPVEDILPLGEKTAVAEHYDWLVVGAGITGLSAARRLGEIASQDSVLLVDARPVGWGASGRNSGFLIDLPHKFDLERPEPDRLHKIVNLNRTAIADLGAAVDKHGIECDWSHAGKLQGAVQERGNGMLQKFCEALDFIREPYEVLDRGGCAEIMGTDYYAGAVFTPGCILMDPFRLVRGLARNLPPNVTLKDDTAVMGFTPENGRFRVELRTAVGEKFEVTCGKVILGTDPYTPEFGYMTDRVLPTITYASITRRLTERELALYKGRLNWGLTPADAAGTTLRMTADARLLIRNLYAFAPRYQAEDRHLVKARKAHREGLDARFPQFSGVPFSSTWGGVVSLSRNHETFFGEMAPGVYSSNCYNGVGMTRGSISGKLLADLATGNYSQQLEDMISVSGMPSRIPPDPIRSMGVSARFKLAEWESQDEV